MNENGQTEAELKKRIADLEAELAHVKADRDWQKKTLYYWAQIPPEWEKPLTAEEVDELMNAPRGDSMETIIAEFEKRLGQS